MSYLLEDLQKTAFLFDRYKGNEEVAEAKLKYKKDHEDYKNLPDNNKLRRAALSKLRLRDVKTKADMARSPKKSKYQTMLEEKYQKDGLTEEEAKLKAFRKHRARKHLMVGAGAAAALGAGIGAYKYHDYVTDKTIKAGKTLQNVRVGQGDRFNTDDPFFTAHGKDSAKYRGMYGKQLKSEQGIFSQQPITKADLEVTQDIKIPSRKKTKETFKNMIGNDAEKRKILEEGIGDVKSQFQNIDKNPLSKRNRLLNRAHKKISKGVVDGDVCDAAQIRFNKTLRTWDPKFGDQIENEMYKSLKNQGYHGLIDRHDEKYSGYKAKSANILFDHKDRIKVKAENNLSDKDINRDYIKSAKGFMANTVLRSPILHGAVGSTVALKKLKDHTEEKRNDRKVQAYRRQNPNSIKNYYEILENSKYSNT